MRKMLCFDMDGTIADLYAVPNWLPLLRQFNPTPYAEAEPMWDMKLMCALLRKLQAQGWEISVITWLSKETTPAFDREVRKAKMEWLSQFNFPYDHFHGISYGIAKTKMVKHKTDYAILFDDNVEIRNAWNLGAAIDPEETNLLFYLAQLIEQGE